MTLPLLSLIMSRGVITKHSKILMHKHQDFESLAEWKTQVESSPKTENNLSLYKKSSLCLCGVWWAAAGEENWGTAWENDGSTSLNRRITPKWSYPVSPNCSSETTEQNHKLCRWSMCRGENLDLQLLLETRSQPTPTHRTKGPGHNQNLNTRTLSELRVSHLGRFDDDVPYYKWPNSNVLYLKLAPPALLHTYSQSKPLKTCPEPWIREFRLLSISFLFS